MLDARTFAVIDPARTALEIDPDRGAVRAALVLHACGSTVNMQQRHYTLGSAHLVGHLPSSAL